MSSVATLRLGSIGSIWLFGMLGSIFVVLLLVMCSVVFSRTARGAWRGALLVSPTERTP